MPRRFTRLVIASVALLAISCAPDALADGLPVPGVMAPAGGLPGPGGRHFVANADHGRTTVQEVGRAGGVRSRTVPGRFTIPAVALDGSPSGISADGSTLVLIKPRRNFPQSRTHMLILDAHKLTVRQRLTLNGDFSFDAIAPDGSTIYLIDYLSPRDPTRYAVRAYDLDAGRLVPNPIVDPDEHAGEMRGLPMTRAMSLDGRWAYTLYDGGGGEPFVHALDTAEGRAVCVDLDGLVTPRDAHGAVIGFNPDGSELTVAAHHQALAAIDTATLEAADPSPPQTPADGEDGGAGGFPWVLVAAVAGFALVGGGAAIGARRRRGSGLAAPGA